MDKSAIENEIRLYCVEWLSTLTAAILLKASGNPQQMLAEWKSQAIARARDKTFLGVDPTMSHHLSAELESGVDRLLKMIEHFLEKN